VAATAGRRHAKEPWQAIAQAHLAPGHARVSSTTFEESAGALASRPRDVPSVEARNGAGDSGREDGIKEGNERLNTLFVR